MKFKVTVLYSSFSDELAQEMENLGNSEGVQNFYYQIVYSPESEQYVAFASYYVVDKNGAPF